MNSNSGRVLRSNARRRTPLSNSTRKDHHRSTTELYSPRDAPTTHTTHHDAATSATGAHDALQRVPTVPRRCCAQCARFQRSSTAAIIRAIHTDQASFSCRPIARTITSTTVHAHTRAHPRSHARHGLARAQPSVHDARTRSAHTLKQHMTPALGARTHTSSPPVHARTRTAISPSPPAATTSRWVYC